MKQLASTGTRTKKGTTKIPVKRPAININRTNAITISASEQNENNNDKNNHSIGINNGGQMIVTVVTTSVAETKRLTSTVR